MEKKKCPDCIECQRCSKNRCRVCRNGAHKDGASELASGFTYGQYLEWKRRKPTRVEEEIR
jgi:Zn-dependent alcohol dehydrogenase